MTDDPAGERDGDAVGDRPAEQQVAEFREADPLRRLHHREAELAEHEDGEETTHQRRHRQERQDGRRAEPQAGRRHQLHVTATHPAGRERQQAHDEDQACDAERPHPVHRGAGTQHMRRIEEDERDADAVGDTEGLQIGHESEAQDRHEQRNVAEMQRERVDHGSHLQPRSTGCRRWSSRGFGRWEPDVHPGRNRAAPANVRHRAPHIPEAHSPLNRG
jgi:hypothetical protein